MENKLYVGNLSYNTDESALQTLFEEVGTVKSVQLIKDRETGRSKGFAFVEMSTNEEAEQAISLFDGKEVDGRALKVNVAKPRESRGGDRRRGGPSRGRDRRPGGGGRGRN